MRSYQVRGHTNELDKWDWEYHRCENPRSCWGPQTRLLEIQRHCSTKIWMFNFFNLVSNHNGSSVNSIKPVEKLYFRTSRDPRDSRLEENGFKSRGTQLNLFLQNDKNDKSMKFIHIQMNSKECLPEEFRNQPLDTLPPYYLAPRYKCPNSAQFNIYEGPSHYDGLIDTSFLVEKCVPVEKIFLNMYPGGQGLQVRT